MTSESGQPTSLVRKVTRIVAKRFGIVICSNKCLWSEMHIEHLQAQLERSHKHAERLKRDSYSNLEQLKSFRYIVEELAKSGKSVDDLFKWIDGQENKQSESAFSEEEIKVLIRLCHPDRHQGKQSAVSITQKLLGMRGKP